MSGKFAECSNTTNHKLMTRLLRRMKLPLNSRTKR